MILVAITGNICSGKSSILSIFQRYNIPTFNYDQVYRNLINNDQALKSELYLKMNYVFNEGGDVDFEKLFEALKSQGNLSVLESIFYPAIERVRKRFQEYNRRNKRPICVSEVPLLFEKNLQNSFHYIITTYCSEKMKKHRFLCRMRKRGQLADDEKESMERYNWFRSKQMNCHHQLRRSDASVNTMQSKAYNMIRCQKIILQIQKKM